MALTSTDRSRVRYYLGWTQRYLQTDNRLELAMSAADNSPETLLLIQDVLANGGLLAALADVDAQLAAAMQTIVAVKVGSIELLRGGEYLGVIRSEGRRLVGRLASTLGVAVRHDVYSGAGPSGFAGYHGLYGDGSGGGNLPPLG